jgi:citrate synthase
MTPFWTTQPLDAEQVALLNACRRAHAETAKRQNASTGGLVNAAQASRSYTQALAAALMTLGEVHAPVPKAVQLLQRPDPAAVARNILAAGLRVPGWGNAFHKESIDPEWRGFADLLGVYRPDLDARIKEVTTELHEHGKIIYANAACFTAATAIAVGLPAEASIYLVIAGRLSTWSAIFLQSLNNQPKTT